jgi:RNA polymerase sigma-70 factor (sigma-E family)
VPHDAHTEAFTNFVATRQHALIRFAWLICGGRYADAQDLVQEALSRLYGRWANVNDPEALARTIIVRLNISRWRRLRREVLTSDRIERGEHDRALDTVGADADLARLVLALPPQQRTALVLRYWLDHSIEQIADIQGCAPVTVRTNIHRAIVRLRSLVPALSDAHTTGRSS